MKLQTRIYLFVISLMLLILGSYITSHYIYLELVHWVFLILGGTGVLLVVIVLPSAAVRTFKDVYSMITGK